MVGAVSKAGTPIKSTALVAVSIALTFVVAEQIARVLDGQPPFAMPLILGTPDLQAPPMPAVPLADGVSASWFHDRLPQLPNRRAPPAEWLQAMDDYRSKPVVQFQGGVLLPADMFKAWNSVFAGDLCQHSLLAHMPSRKVYLYDPSDGTQRPQYRYMPNATTPIGLVTNEIGWRGPPLRARKANTVRIVFIGASTTADSHDLPFSYPEMIDHWLREWAASKTLDLDVQALNAGREGVISTDIAEIVRTEVAPMRPDLVVYYEGANQFSLLAMTQGVGPASGKRSTLPLAERTWLSRLADYSSLARRVQSALNLVGERSSGKEAEKPPYTLEWPRSVSEADPDLADSSLPINLGTILHDLDDMRSVLREIDAELAVSSFKWLVKDGMVVDPLQGRNIWNMLNITYWPWRYRDMERLAAFQNRVFEKYAGEHHLPFIDVAHDMPFDPDLFSDAIHNTAAGVRVRAWVVFQRLVPIIEDRLKRGVWPKRASEEEWPTFKPRTLAMECK